MKVKNTTTGEVFSLVFMTLNPEGEQIVGFDGKPLKTTYDGFGFPFPAVITEDGIVLDNSEVELINEP